MALAASCMIREFSECSRAVRAFTPPISTKLSWQQKTKQNNTGPQSFLDNKKAHAFLQPTCANSHQYQLNNPIILPYYAICIAVLQGLCTLMVMYIVYLILSYILIISVGLLIFALVIYAHVQIKSLQVFCIIYILFLRGNNMISDAVN